MPKYPLLDLVIVGAQKSFTTSLKEYIGGHPSVITHPQKEMGFFIDDGEYILGYKKAFIHYYKSVKRCQNKKILAKSAMLYMSEKAIKRLHEHSPGCKIILSLRNPVDRAYSSYLMEYNHSDLGFPFEEIKSIAEKADSSYWPYTFFIDAGNYARHLKILYKYFPKDQVMIVLCPEIREDPVKVCREIFQWIGVNDAYIPEIKVYNPTLKGKSKFYARVTHTLLNQRSLIRKSTKLFVPSYYNYKVGDVIRKVNKTKEKYKPMDSAMREYLLAYYRDANKELEEITGKRVTTLWSK